MDRKQFFRIVAGAAVVLSLTAGQAFASNAGTADEAKSMTKRAVAAVKVKGAEAAYAEFINGTEFKDRDLYVSVYDMKGNCLAHGANAKLVGKNLWDLKDANGVEVIKMQTAIASSKGEGWSDPFTFVNPQTKAMQPKATYIQRVGETWIAVGYYK